MDSPTKRRLSPEAIEDIARTAFGSSVRVREVRELTEGTFNASYAVTIDGQPPAVLKVAPAPDVPVLRYERDLMRTELDFYERVRRAGVAPVPEVLASGEGWFLMRRLEGAPLTSAPVSKADRKRVREQLGTVAARLSAVRGEGFGYRQLGLAATWREAFAGMTGALFADAEQYNTKLPRSLDELRRLFEARAPLLDEVRTPSLVHFDLWDGNVFVKRDSSGMWTLEAIIDGERALWGDPLAELPSASLLGSIEKEPDLLAGYGRARGAALELTREVKARIALYRSYLYLIMLVEAAPRRSSGVKWFGIRTFVELRLRGALKELETLG